MTLLETAEILYSIAARLKDFAAKDPYATWPHQIKGLGPESAIGAAALICYVRDLITSSPKEDYSRGELLVVLETISNDDEIFPLGTGRLLWQVEFNDDTPDSK